MYLISFYFPVNISGYVSLVQLFTSVIMSFVVQIALHPCILIVADTPCSGKETCSLSHSWGCSFHCDFILIKAICSSRAILLGFFAGVEFCCVQI